MSRQGLLCVSTMLLNHAAGTWGDAAIAGMSIVGRITMLVMAVVIGLGQGFQPLCGFCYGAKLYSRLKRAWWFTTIVGTVFLLAVSGLGWLFSSELIALFRDDMEVVAVGVVALRWQLLTLPLCATMMSSNMLTQTCRKPWRANLLAASRNGLFFIPSILVLPCWLGLTGVEVCQSVSDLFAFIVTVRSWSIPSENCGLSPWHPCWHACPSLVFAHLIERTSNSSLVLLKFVSSEKKQVSPSTFRFLCASSPSQPSFSLRFPCKRSKRPITNSRLSYAKWLPSARRTTPAPTAWQHGRTRTVGLHPYRGRRR